MGTAISIIVAIILVILFNYFLYRKPKSPKKLDYAQYYQEVLTALRHRYSIVSAARALRIPYLSNELYLSDDAASDVIHYSFDRDADIDTAAKAVFEAILIRRHETQRNAEQALRGSTNIHGMSREQFAETVRAAERMSFDRQHLRRQMLEMLAMQTANPEVRTVLLDQTTRPPPPPKKKPEKKAKKKDRFELLDE